MSRIRVVGGDAATDATTRGAICDGLSGLLADYRQKVATYTAETRPAALDRAREELDALEFKVECYGTRLDDRRAEVEAALADTRRAVRARLFLATDALGTDDADDADDADEDEDDTTPAARGHELAEAA